MENKKYSILIVGIKCYFGHVMEFVVNLKKKNPQVDITLILSPIPDEVNKELSRYVNRIVIHKTYKNKIVPHFIIGRMNAILCYLTFLRLYLRNHFDIVDIHFVKPYIKYAMPIIKRMTKNIVITPWGSDVMRVENAKSIDILCEIYSQARYVTVDKDSQIGQCAIRKFKVDPDKMVALGWGGEFFDYMEENSEIVTTEEAKARFGLSGRYVITCGYNMRKAQRLEDIIDAIYDIKDQLPENLTLLFMRTYRESVNKKVSYSQTIINKGRAMGFDVVMVKDYLDMEDLLKLRKATDIFVHVQTTDAGSRSVMEYVLCNKKVVHGSWNKYLYLEKYKPSCYFPVDKIEDLGTCIVNAYQSQVGELPQEVRNIILERGWSHRMNLWNEFFESLAF